MFCPQNEQTTCAGVLKDIKMPHTPPSTPKARDSHNHKSGESSFSGCDGVSGDIVTSKMVVDKDRISREVVESLDKFQYRGQVTDMQECQATTANEEFSSKPVDEVMVESSPVCVKEQTIDPMNTSIILEPGEDLPGSVTTSAKHSISQEDSVVTTIQDQCSTAHAVAKTTELVSTIIDTKITTSEKKVGSLI